MQFKLSKIISVLTLSCLGSAAWAGNITGINLTNTSDDSALVKIRFDSGAVSPRGFITPSPARIALDFPDTTLKLGGNQFSYDSPLVKQIVTAQAADRTRLVLALTQTSRYTTEVHGNEVWVKIDQFNRQQRLPAQAAAPAPTPAPAKVAASAKVTAPVAAAAPVATAATKAQVAQAQVAQPTAKPVAPETPVVPEFSATVDFHKGIAGSGIVDLNVKNFNGKPEVTRSADKLILVYRDALLPANLQRNLDVTDFNTPIRTIEVRRLGSDTQVTVRMQGGWDYRASLKGERQSLTIQPQTDTASEGLGENKKAFKGGKISLDFQNVDVRTILQILARESGLNIIASDSVRGQMSLTLKDVPWDQALDLVMQTNNLDMRRTGNIINIAPRQELLERDSAALKARNEIETLGPLVTQTFQLKYKNVEDLKETLNIDNSSSRNIDGNSILSARGSALIDKATNTLIITDTAPVVQKFERLINQLDVPAQQVMVEVRIVEAQDGVSRQLGVKFGYRGEQGRSSFGSSIEEAAGNVTQRRNYDRAMDSVRKAADREYVESKSTDKPISEEVLSAKIAEGLANIAAPVFAFSPNISLPAAAATTTFALVRSFSSSALGLELQAMQEQNKVKIVSSPRVLTQDRKEAAIESGTEVPYQEASSSGATSTSFKKAVLGLKVTPQITPDGQVIMDIRINKDSVNQACSAYAPCIDTKNLDTRAMVEDGGTLILGGIYEEVNANAETKVPLLGDLPVVGNLFKHRSRNQSRKELLVFITPRIMNNTGSVLRY